MFNNALFSDLKISFIYPGTAPACDPSLPVATDGVPPPGGPNVLPQTCTPSNGGAGSPFTFHNTNPPPSQGGPHSAADFTFGGVTADGTATWTGTFTSQFTTSWQQVLINLGNQGFVENSYSGTIVVTANPPTTPTPEPGTMVLLGLGLCGIGVLKFRKTA